jgi:hypothetical protein
MIANERECAGVKKEFHSTRMKNIYHKLALTFYGNFMQNADTIATQQFITINTPGCC